jgi:hypothetical protein
LGEDRSHPCTGWGSAPRCSALLIIEQSIHRKGTLDAPAKRSREPFQKCDFAEDQVDFPTQARNRYSALVDFPRFFLRLSEIQRPPAQYALRVGGCKVIPRDLHLLFGDLVFLGELLESAGDFFLFVGFRFGHASFCSASRTTDGLAPVARIANSLSASSRSLCSINNSLLQNSRREITE